MGARFYLDFSVNDMELKEQGRERTHDKKHVGLGIIKMFNQIDLMPQNEDQEHRQLAQSWQQGKSKNKQTKTSPILPPLCSYTLTYLEARVNLLAPNASAFWKWLFTNPLLVKGVKKWEEDHPILNFLFCDELLKRDRSGQERRWKGKQTEELDYRRPNKKFKVESTAK